MQKKIINLIENIQKEQPPKESNQLWEDMVTLTHDYIGLSDAIKLANKHRDKYRIKRKIIELIE